MKHTTLALLFAAFLSLPSVTAQESKPDPLLRWMDRIAQQQLQRRENAIAEIHTVADAEHRKKLVRERLLEILGGLPD
jgi:hypothetical protein